MKTLNDGSPRPEAQWTWTRICKDKKERSGLDYIVVEHGNRKEMRVHVGVEDVGTTDHSLIWTESQQTKTRRSRRGRNCLLYTSPSPRDGLLSRMPSSA